GLCQPLDAGDAGIETKTSLLVLGPHMPGTEAQLESPAAQDVQRRGFACDQYRMSEVVVEHRRTNAEPRGRRGCGGQSEHRREQIREVIGHEQHVVAEGFDLPSFVCPLAVRTAGPYVDTESEWPHRDSSVATNS